MAGYAPAVAPAVQPASHGVVFRGPDAVMLKHREQALECTSGGAMFRLDRACGGGHHTSAVVCARIRNELFRVTSTGNSSVCIMRSKVW